MCDGGARRVVLALGRCHLEILRVSALAWPCPSSALRRLAVWRHRRAGLTALEAEALVVSVEAACRAFRGLRPRGKRGSCRPAAMRVARSIGDDLIEFGKEREEREEAVRCPLFAECES